MNITDEIPSRHKLRADCFKYGYLALKNFFSPAQLNTFLRGVEHLRQKKASAASEISIDVLEGRYLGQRMKLRDTPDEAILN